MNLGKLLAAGKSIMGGRRQISYHVVGRAYVPKFISPKNPFAPPDKTEAPAPPAVAAKQETASGASRISNPPIFPMARPRGQRWIGKLNPVSLWRRSTAAGPQKVQCPRQAELSLDRVKVVHNDLSDVDVEIVPIKSRTAPEAVAPAPVNGGDSWSRLGAKIFGVKAA